MPKKIGFSDVQNAVTTKLNVELTEPITEWINKLEDKFGVVKQAADVRFCVSNSRKRAVAFVHFKLIDLTDEEYTFSPKYFNKSVKEYSDLLDSWGKINWRMPHAEENVKFYTATHEYGHMLQNMMILQTMKDKGWTAKDPGAFINWKGITADSRFKMKVQIMEIRAELPISRNGLNLPQEFKNKRAVN